ncbi:MAG: ABC transporter permease subunit, partial [Moorea sp. SIO3B2]|nr:ABC transporter permease subunit [Moorena sp. SIO3B2]
MTEKLIRLNQTKRLSPTLIRNLRERGIEILLFLAALSSVATMAAIIFFLLRESLAFFKEVSLIDFLTDTKWTPMFLEKHYGILPLISGTLVTATTALLLAIPTGTIAAIYLSEFAPPTLREIIKPGLELLAAIPTVVYGYFALLVVSPLLRNIFTELPVFNMLSAGLVMGLMIIPFISSISEDAMRAVPVELREGSYAMG